MVQAKIAVIYSSTYGHVRTLAESIAEASRKAGAEVTIYQFPEILSDEVLAKMHAAPKADYPIIKPDDLVQYDGFLFGIPTRYGRAVGAASAFFDATGGLWAKGSLVGKSAGIFTSAASQHGGLESTALTTIPFLAHQGIAFVPIGFVVPALTDNTEIVGGSAYGAAAIAGGDGSRGLTVKELEIAAYQGTSFTKFVTAYVRGNAQIASEATAFVVPSTATSEEPVAVKSTTLDAEAAILPKPAAEEKVETKPATTPTTATSAPAPTTTPKKSSGGIFSMCCGGGKDNYET